MLMESESPTIKKVRVSDLRVGMHVEKIVPISWLSSPLVTSNFRISSHEDIRKLVDFDIENVFINISKGIDIGQIDDVQISTSVTEPQYFQAVEARLDDFWMNLQVPVDLYQLRNGSYDLIIKKGLVLSSEAFGVLKSADVAIVFYPQDQKRFYEKYRLDLENLSEQRKAGGYSGPFTNPAVEEAHVRFILEYHPINAVALVPGVVIGFDIHFRHEGGITVLLYKNTRLSEEARTDWIKRNLNLLVLKEDLAAYHDYLTAMSKTAGNTQAKCAIIRESSKIIIESLAENPRSEKLIGQTMSTVKDLIHVVMENPGAFYAIMKLNSYDYYTFTHSVNVATLSIALGVAAGISKVSDLTDLALGAILHDIGKSQIDPALINKPGTLTEKEYSSVTSHVIKGYEMLRWNSSIPASALIPLMQHHEKLNGSGYPNGLHGSQIHIFGRIVAIIDVYDALTTERAYRKALKPFDALSIISKAFKDYDRELFTRLVNLIRAQKAQEE